MDYVPNQSLTQLTGETAMDFPFKDQDYERLAQMIKNLDRRLKRIEAHLDLELSEEGEDVTVPSAAVIKK